MFIIVWWELPSKRKKKKITKKRINEVIMAEKCDIHKDEMCSSPVEEKAAKEAFSSELEHQEREVLEREIVKVEEVVISSISDIFLYKESVNKVRKLIAEAKKKMLHKRFPNLEERLRAAYFTNPDFFQKEETLSLQARQWKGLRQLYGNDILGALPSEVQAYTYQDPRKLNSLRGFHVPHTNAIFLDRNFATQATKNNELSHVVIFRILESLPPDQKTEVQKRVVEIIKQKVTSNYPQAAEKLTTFEQLDEMLSDAAAMAVNSEETIDRIKDNYGNTPKGYVFTVEVLKIIQERAPEEILSEYLRLGQEIRDTILETKAQVQKN